MSIKFTKDPLLMLGVFATVSTLLLWTLADTLGVVSHYGIVGIFTITFVISFRNYIKSCNESFLGIDLLMIVAAIGAVLLGD